MAPQLAEENIVFPKNPNLPPAIDPEIKQIAINSALQKICDNNNKFKPFEYSQNIISNGKFFIEANKDSLLRISSQRYSDEELLESAKIKFFFESFGLVNNQGKCASERSYTVIARYKVSTFIYDEKAKHLSHLLKAEDIYGKSFISNHYERKEKQSKDLLLNLPQNSIALISDSFLPQGFSNIDKNTFTRDIFAPNKIPITVTISVDPKQDTINAFLVPCFKDKLYQNNLWFKEITDVSIKSLSDNTSEDHKPLLEVKGTRAKLKEETEEPKESTYYFTFDEETRRITLEENIKKELIK